MNPITQKIFEVLQGSSREKKVHWNDIKKETEDKSLCSASELVASMNGILLPFGEVSGTNHYYWIGRP